jgi:hypothetical protein
MKWKGFGRKRPWHNWSTFPELSWGDRWNPRKSLRITSVQTQDLRSIGVECFSAPPSPVGSSFTCNTSVSVPYFPFPFRLCTQLRRPWSGHIRHVMPWPTLTRGASRCPRKPFYCFVTEEERDVTNIISNNDTWMLILNTPRCCGGRLRRSVLCANVTVIMMSAPRVLAGHPRALPRLYSV